MADIVIKQGAGILKTEIDLLGGDQAVSSIELWAVDDAIPDHFKEVRAVKRSSDPEAKYYVVGSASESDGLYLEWRWTATRAPGSSAATGTVKLRVQQDGQDVSGYPVSMSFDYDDLGPVSYSFTRRIRAAD